MIKIALKDEYIDKFQGEKLQLYNKKRVTVSCHVSYCRIYHCLGQNNKETILHNVKIKIGDEIYKLPEEEYKFDKTDCFDEFVGCDVEFVATINITMFDDEYYIDILRPSKILEISLKENEAVVTHFTRATETFMYSNINKELPTFFYDKIKNMDKYKVGHGRYFTMTLEEAYECNYGRINVR